MTRLIKSCENLYLCIFVIKLSLEMTYMHGYIISITTSTKFIEYLQKKFRIYIWNVIVLSCQ